MTKDAQDQEQKPSQDAEKVKELSVEDLENVAGGLGLAATPPGKVETPDYIKAEG